MKNNLHRKITGFSFILVLVSIVISTVVSMYSMKAMGMENRKELNLVLASGIHDTINSALTEPIMAAKTMASGQALVSFLEEEESENNTDKDVLNMQKTLSRLQRGLGYESVFVVSAKTGRYYTQEGLNKIVDPENDEHDVWYSLFLEKNTDYDLDVDVDEVHNNTWTVFVNTRVTDNGRLLGVCGVGVKMKNLQDMLYDYEKQYDMKINLVDSKGLVQVDTDEINIEKVHMNNVTLSEKNSREYIYTEGENGEYIVSKYVKNLGWYLVVTNRENLFADDILRVITLNGFLFLAVILIFSGNIHIMRRRTKLLLTSSYYDQLTGLQNRRAYEETLSGMTLEKMKSDFVYVIADVNGLKRNNDNIGHSAGDEMIRGAAECLNKAFSQYGDLFRIGGDEFAALLRIPREEFEEVKRNLKKLTSSWRGELVRELSISVGYVPYWDVEEMQLYEIIEEADKRMYDDKKEYYTKQENNRRYDI
ncbi:MAG: diguanylate cyclase [Clostridia bacterium]|nr:diguanylate cyclase [Clostridia bacterium]